MTQMTNSGEALSRTRDDGPGRGGLFVLGVILIAAFLLPVLERQYSRRSFYRSSNPPEYKLKFVNIEMLSSDERLPTIARFMAVYPAIAGVVILIVAGVAPSIVRAGTVTGLGIILYMAMLIGGDERQAMNWLPRGAGGVLLIYFLVSLGLTGVLAGSLARRYRPRSNLAAIVGIVGGVLFLAGMLLPVLPKDAGVVLLAVPFKLFDAEKDLATAIGVLVLLAMVAWIIASILCFTNVPRRGGGSAKAMGAGTFYTFLAGAILLFVAILVPVCADNHDAAQFGASILAFGKLSSWVTGSFLILPLGLAGLTIAVHDTPLSLVKASRPATQSSGDRLHELDRLHEQGMISDEEYKEQRTRILSSL